MREGVSERSKTGGWWRLLASVAVLVALVVAGGCENSVWGQDKKPTPEPEPVSSYEYGQVVPTTEWVNFYSFESTLRGEPVPVGAVVTAYDPDGVVCGEFLITHTGQYGVMPVYRDDPGTEVDEGAEAGDEIGFRINGIEAGAMGPERPLWTAFGDLKKVNLQAPAR